MSGASRLSQVAGCDAAAAQCPDPKARAWRLDAQDRLDRSADRLDTPATRHSRSTTIEPLRTLRQEQARFPGAALVVPGVMTMLRPRGRARA